jgi:hypothetical protein
VFKAQQGLFSEIGVGSTLVSPSSDPHIADVAMGMLAAGAATLHLSRAVILSSKSSGACGMGVCLFVCLFV